MELKRPLALSGLVAVAVLGPDDDLARTAADKSRVILERLAARAWLDRLDELVSRTSRGGSSMSQRDRRADGSREGSLATVGEAAEEGT